MKLLNASSISRSNHYNSSIGISSYKVSNAQLSEQDIIVVSDKFLTPGFHKIQVDSIEHGRNLIGTFLTSLNYYHDVAMLSLEDVNRSTPHNIYQSLMVQEKVQSAYDFTEFLCNNFYHDFLWIEATPELAETVWFKELEYELFNLNFDKIIPIVILSYRQL